MAERSEIVIKFSSEQVQNENSAKLCRKCNSAFVERDFEDFYH